MFQETMEAMRIMGIPEEEQMGRAGLLRAREAGRLTIAPCGAWGSCWFREGLFLVLLHRLPVEVEEEPEQLELEVWIALQAFARAWPTSPCRAGAV